MILLLSAKTGFLGLRQPKNAIALDLAKYLGRPITATSANPSAHLSKGFDSYSAEDVVSQFKHKRHQPDIVIDAGRLPKRKPSTVLKLSQVGSQVLRLGPISEKQIIKVLKK
jgi:L-threonylcarbamoyladenylate synthase